MERIQYNSVLAITGTTRSTARDKISKDLGVETRSRRKLNPLCTFHKIKTTGLPLYLFPVTKDTSYHYLTRSVKKKKKNLHINVEQKALNHLSSHGPLLNAKNQNLKFKMCPAQLLKKHLFKKISLPSNSVFNMHNLIGLEFITKLRLILTLIVKVI